MALLKKPATMTWGQWARSERAKAIAEHPELQEQPGKEKKCMDCPRLRHIALLRPGGVYKWGPRCGEHKLVVRCFPHPEHRSRELISRIAFAV